MAPRDGGSTYYQPLPPKRNRFGIPAEEYMELRQKVDGANNLWRIHDRIYDLSNFAKSHPGGSHWITMTKGIDITELFESHHIGPAAGKVLEKFSWKPATTPRRSPFTFHDDGFYRRVKRKAAEAIKDVPDRGVTWKSAAVSDTLAIIAAVAAVYAALAGSFLSAIVSGLAIGLLFTSAHNFTHLKSNWRQYYVPVAMISMKDWRVSHIFSHHHFANTDLDMEVLDHEPLLDYFPRDGEKWKRWLQCFAFPFYAAFKWPYGGILRLIHLRGELVDLLNLSPLFVMLATSLIAGQGINGILMDLVLFAVIAVTESSTSFMIGLTVAHHHPDIYHHGDEPREDRDWGLGQLDAVRDRADSRTHFLLSSVTFGDHSTHHLFPSLDHGRLRLVRPAIDETLKEMGLKRMEESWPNLLVGMFKQILRNEARPLSARNMSKKDD